MSFDRRKSQRYITKSLIAITHKGVAQVSNLTTDSVFFRCMKKIDFPDYWVMDLYDTMGLNLEGVLVKKVWSKVSGKPNDSKLFHSEVAAEFKNLSSSQIYQLTLYLSHNNE